MKWNSYRSRLYQLDWLSASMPHRSHSHLDDSLCAINTLAKPEPSSHIHIVMMMMMISQSAPHICSHLISSIRIPHYIVVSCFRPYSLWSAEKAHPNRIVNKTDATEYRVSCSFVVCLNRIPVVPDPGRVRFRDEAFRLGQCVFLPLIWDAALEHVSTPSLAPTAGLLFRVAFPSIVPIANGAQNERNGFVLWTFRVCGEKWKSIWLKWG